MGIWHFSLSASIHGWKEKKTVLKDMNVGACMCSFPRMFLFVFDALVFLSAFVNSIGYDHRVYHSISIHLGFATNNK